MISRWLLHANLRLGVVECGNECTGKHVGFDQATGASFGTASIAQQIANGFAGEIGMSPPGIDNIVDDGIRMPEGQESEEENRRRR